MVCFAASVNKTLWMRKSEDVTNEEYASLNKLQLTRCTNTSSSGGDSSEFSAIPTNFKYTGLDYDGYEFVDDSIHEQVSIAIPSKANRPIEDIERENVKDSDLIVFKHDTPVIVEEPAGRWFNWQQLESVEPVEQSDRGWNMSAANTYSIHGSGAEDPPANSKFVRRRWSKPNTAKHIEHEIQHTEHPDVSKHIGDLDEIQHIDDPDVTKHIGDLDVAQYSERDPPSGGGASKQQAQRGKQEHCDRGGGQSSTSYLEGRSGSKNKFG